MEMNSIPWSPVLRYATPLPHRFDRSAPTQVRFVRFAVRHTPPDQQDPRFDRSAPTQVRFLRFAVRHTPPDQQDPCFDRRRSVSSVLRYASPCRSRGPRFERGRSNTRPFPPFCGTLGLVSIACFVQALPMNMTTHSVPTQPIGSHAFRCL